MRASERKIFLLLDGLREDLRKPLRGTLAMKTKSQKEPLGGFRRSSRRPSQRKILVTETLSLVAPNCLAPSCFSKALLAIAAVISFAVTSR